jgi:hypothetical protein
LIERLFAREENGSARGPKSGGDAGGERRTASHRERRQRNLINKFSTFRKMAV